MSPAFRRLCKGPRPQVTLSSVTEGEEHQSVSRQVFLEASPTANNSESEANAAEDIPAASADEQEEPRDEEEHVATPPTNPEFVLEENVFDPPATQVEVNNIEAATTNTNEATDVVMAEANVEPTPTHEPEVSEANDATAPVPAPAAGPQFDYHIEHRPQVQKPMLHLMQICSLKLMTLLQGHTLSSKHIIMVS